MCVLIYVTNPRPAPYTVSPLKARDRYYRRSRRSHRPGGTFPHVLQLQGVLPLPAAARSVQEQRGLPGESES